MKRVRISKLLQYILSDFFNQQIPTSVSGALITITQVKVVPNLSLAKVYISIMPTSKELSIPHLLAQIGGHKWAIKKYLVQQVGKKLRRVPELQFYLDETAKKASELTQVLAKL